MPGEADSEALKRRELVYNPLDKKNLGISVANSLLDRPVEPLPPAEKFRGAGVYAIYYVGDFPAYGAVRKANTEGSFTQPIYIGKAIPSGARKGNLGLDIEPGYSLINRLGDHADSIKQARNLKPQDFHCRFLVVDDIWIPLGESLLIHRYMPIWNVLLDGFGNHDPGAGRYQQMKSPWDVIHPGRSWADKCKPHGKTEGELLHAIAEAEKRKRNS